MLLRAVNSWQNVVLSDLNWCHIMSVVVFVLKLWMSHRVDIVRVMVTDWLMFIVVLIRSHVWREGLTVSVVQSIRVVSIRLLLLVVHLVNWLMMDRLVMNRGCVMDWFCMMSHDWVMLSHVVLVHNGWSAAVFDGRLGLWLLLLLLLRSWLLWLWLFSLGSSWLLCWLSFLFTVGVLTLLVSIVLAIIGVRGACRTRVAVVVNMAFLTNVHWALFMLDNVMDGMLILISVSFSLNNVLDVAFASIIWVSKDLVGLLNLPSLTLVLKDATTLLTPQLLLLLLPAPLFFVDLACEERLNFVVLVVQLELFLAHVRVSDAELSVLFVGFPLFLGYLELFLG